MIRKVAREAISSIGEIVFSYRKKSIPREKIRSVLVIMLYFRGDVLMCTPALRMLKKMLPEAEVNVWVKSRSECLLVNNPNVDRIIVFDGVRTADYEKEEGSGLKEKSDFLNTLREDHYDLCIDLTGKYSTALIAMMGGFKYSSGINYNGFGFCYNRFSDLDTQNTRGHLSLKYSLAIRDALDVSESEWNGLGGYDLKAEYYPTESELRDAAQMLEASGAKNGKPVICIQPKAGWKAKEWGREKYSELIRMCKDMYNFILIGSEAEREYCKTIADGAELENSRIFSGNDLRMSAALICESDLFVGSDSVGLQLAGALEVPSVALFGPTNPEFSNPTGELHRVIYRKLYCSAGESQQYCTRNAGKSCTVFDCLVSVKAEDVAAEIKSLLDRSNFDNSRA